MKKEQVFTPHEIVCFMLDKIGYCGANIINSTIFEPSFGEGAFLIEIVSRIIEYCNTNNLSSVALTNMLDNVYGYEIDRACYDVAINKLNELLSTHNLVYDWHNLICGDTLMCGTESLYDYIVGNPPYIRVHELSSEVKKVLASYTMCKGNTDMYIAFMEHCLNLLSAKGRLCFITPNSFMRNSSQKRMRDELISLEVLDSLWDFGSLEMFNVSTYTAITLFDRQHKGTKLNYYAMQSLNTMKFRNIIDLSLYKGKVWGFVSKEDTAFLNAIFARHKRLSDICDIQQGIETNLNTVYLLDEPAAKELNYECMQKAVKGSTLGNGKYIIFPYEYNKECKLLSEDRFKFLAPHTYAYLSEHKAELLKRDLDTNTEWYSYARNQGLRNNNKPKIAVKHFLSKDATNLECRLCDNNEFVYSGIYITAKEGHSLSDILSILQSDEIFKYLYLLGKDYNSGYKAINTKLLKDFGIS